jgi:hypothetical protein
MSSGKRHPRYNREKATLIIIMGMAACLIALLIFISVNIVPRTLGLVWLQATEDDFSDMRARIVAANSQKQSLQESIGKRENSSELMFADANYYRGFL